MIGCIRLAAPPPAALHALRLRLDQRSPRVQHVHTGATVELLADLGRGRRAEAQCYAQALADDAVVLGLAAAVAIAPAPTLVRLAARRASADAPLVVSPVAVEALLAACPVDWLAPFAPFAPALRGLGLVTLADVAALSPAAIGGRFGGDALRAWCTLRGDEPALAPVPAAPRLRARRAFDGLVADQAVLALTLDRLAARLAAALTWRGMQARALALHLHGDDGRQSAGRVLEDPAAGAATLAATAQGLLRAAAASGGVATLELIVGELVPLRGAQLTLFGPVAGGAGDTRRAALDDLAARLGPGALLRAVVAPVGTGRDEARGRFAPWTPR